MKKILMAVAMALTLGGGAAQAALVDYAALYGGVSMDPDLKFEGVSNGMDTGYNVGGVLGWNLAPGISIGVDLMYTSSDYTCCTATLEAFSVMATGIYSFDVGSKVRPFVGIGVGGVQVSYHAPAGILTVNSGSDFRFGYEGIVGLAFPLTAKTDITLAYKYQGSSDGTINDSDSDKVEYKSNNLSLGLVFNLN